MLYVIVVAVALGFAGLLFAGLLSTNSAWLKKRLSQWNHPGGSETIRTFAPANNERPSEPPRH